VLIRKCNRLKEEEKEEEEDMKNSKEQENKNRCTRERLGERTGSRMGKRRRKPQPSQIVLDMDQSQKLGTLSPSQQASQQIQ
jgi:hypothetical protein